MSKRAPGGRPSLVGALSLTLVAGACVNQGPSGPARRGVVVAVPVGPQHMDPDAGVDEFTASVHANTYEWLTTLDPQLRPKPSLAERWSTLDERTWVFQLRSGVRFHDGRPLDAKRAVEAFRRSLERRGGLVSRGIESVEARGDLEIIVRTLEPRVAVIEVADVPIALEAASGSGALVGTGPYTVAAAEVHGDVRLEAFADHWSGPPTVPSLEFRVIPDEDRRLAALAAGDVDLVVNLSSEGARAVEDLPDARLVTHGSLRVIMLSLVTRAGGKLAETPFTDLRVRQAVAYALDRPALVRDALGGFGEVVQQVVTPEIFGYVADLEPIPFQPDVSRDLLAEAGYSEGLAIELSFPTARYQAIDSVAEVLAEQLERVGVRVDLVPQPPESVQRTEPDAPAFLLGWITNRSSKAAYDQLFHTRRGSLGEWNLTRYSDPAFEAAFALAQSASVMDQLPHLISMGRRLRETLPVVPLYRQLDIYAARRDLVFQPYAQRLILGHELSWDGNAAAGR